MAAKEEMRDRPIPLMMVLPCVRVRSCGSPDAVNAICLPGWNSVNSQESAKKMHVKKLYPSILGDSV
jgi:hypothetical protein